METFRAWFRRHFSDPQVVILTMLLLVGTVVLLALGKMLAPVIAALVIAYLLEGPVSLMERLRLPRLAAVSIVFVGFLLFLCFLVLGLFPLLWRQVEQFVQQLPTMISWGQRELSLLPQRYPDVISEQQLADLMDVLRMELTSWGQKMLSLSVASLRGLILVVVFLFLVPFLVFFLLKDKARILRWLDGVFPPHRELALEVWRNVDRQIGNYIRGKVWEICILWAASYVTFSILGLQFAVLISFFIGLSVLVPYIGAIGMAIPVFSIAYFQWGWSPPFMYAALAYIVIQLIDGNILAPLLLSEVVNLHPVVIITAVLLFGGLWGFWGVFFAIPLATLVEAVFNAWPRSRGRSPQEGSAAARAGEAAQP